MQCCKEEMQDKLPGPCSPRERETEQCRCRSSPRMSIQHWFGDDVCVSSSVRAFHSQKRERYQHRLLVAEGYMVLQCRGCGRLGCTSHKLSRQLFMPQAEPNLCTVSRCSFLDLLGPKGQRHRCLAANRPALGLWFLTSSASDHDYPRHGNS